MNGIGCKRFLVAVGLTLGAVAPAAAQAPPPPVVAVAVEGNAPPAITDAGITAEIKAKVEADKIMRNAQIIVSSVDGFVTLVGMVPTDFAHERALEIARGTLGVRRIDDQLRLEISSPSSPGRN